MSNHDAIDVCRAPSPKFAVRSETQRKTMCLYDALYSHVWPKSPYSSVISLFDALHARHERANRKQEVSLHELLFGDAALRMYTDINLFHRCGSRPVEEHGTGAQSVPLTCPCLTCSSSRGAHAAPSPAAGRLLDPDGEIRRGELIEFGIRSQPLLVTEVCRHISVLLRPLDMLCGIVFRALLGSASFGKISNPVLRDNVQLLFSYLLRALTDDQPCMKVVYRLRVIMESLQEWIDARGNLKFEGHLLQCALSVTTGLLVLHCQMVRGGRCVAKGMRRRCTLEGSVRFLLARDGPLRTVAHCRALADFVSMQASSILQMDDNNGVVYCLWNGPNFYVGQAQLRRKNPSIWSGFSDRLSEHFRSFRAHRLGIVGTSARRSRYIRLRVKTGARALMAFVCCRASRSSLFSCELARINNARPNCNNIGKSLQTFGATVRRRSRPPRSFPRSRLRGSWRRAWRWRRWNDDSLSVVVFQGKKDLEAERLAARFTARERISKQIGDLLDLPLAKAKEVFANRRGGSSDPCGKGNFWLLLSMAARRPLEVDFGKALSQHGRSGDLLFDMFEKASYFTSSFLRSRCRGCIRYYANWNSIHIRNEYPLAIYSRDWKPQAKNAVKSLLAPWRQSLPAWSSHVSRRTRFVYKPPSSWRDSLFNAPRMARDLDVDKVLHAIIHWLPQLQEGRDMCRFGYSSKVPKTFSQSEACEWQNKSIGKWLRVCGAPLAAVVHPPCTYTEHELATRDEDCLGSFPEFDIWNDRLQERRADLNPSEPTEDLTITVEDKDPKVLWAQHSLAGAARWIALLISARDRWQLQPLCMEEVLASFRVTIDGSLPSCLRKGKSSISPSSLPYMYYTVKRKCYGGEARTFAPVPRRLMLAFVILFLSSAYLIDGLSGALLEVYSMLQAAL